MNLDQKLHLAVDAHTKGRIEEAETLYRDILKKRTNDPIALHHLGIILYQRRELETAAQLIRKSLAAKKNYPEAYSNLGNVLRDLGKHEEAVAAYKDALRFKPNYPEGFSNLGTALLAQNNPSEALAVFDKAIKLRPSYAEAYFNRGVALRQLGRQDEAVEAFSKAIELKPDLREAHFSLGVVLHEQRKLEAAAEAFQRAIALMPQFAEPYANLSSVLIDLDRIDEAEAACRKAIALKPDFVVAYYNLGVTLKKAVKLDEAIAAFRNAIVHYPNFAEAYCNLGLVFMDQGKALEAIEVYQKAIALKPNFFEAYNNLGVPLREMERLDEAADAYRNAIAANPKYSDAYVNFGNILREQGKTEEAIEAYKQGLAADANNAKAHVQLIHLRRHACDWREFDAETKRLFELAQYVEPFVFLSAPSTAAQQLECSQRWASHFQRGTPFVHARRQRDRIRIGYLSADFRRHATAYLMAELFERHDRSRFETYAYSYGYDDKSDVRQRLIKSFDHFVELRTTPHEESARRIHGDGIDILIDLKGYTGGVRTEILVNRPAPIQVNYLGYPGTMGADFIDYIIADKFVTPMEHQPFYSEKLVQLPDCYQPNDTKREIASTMPTRAQFGLPEQAFVFCSFNGVYKFAPPVFDIWMRLLKTVPGSVMWMLSTSPLVEKNLRREASARGVEPERLVFSPAMPLADHLARHKYADLFLDTLPINAHTTASDSLWAGLPILTCAGGTFAGRVAGSLLEAVGLPELITTSLADYEAVALDLATHPDKLAALRARLAANRLSAPLFDIDRFTKGIEAAYAGMWDRWQAGKPPEAFVVP